ncbi:MAG: hypothetical protein R3B45_01580 [Bdellovibrionota bacterium]
MAAKKVKAKKAGTRKRLTPKVREAIAKESPDLTLAVLAKKYDTSINTITKYRNSGANPAPKAIFTAVVQRAGASKYPTAIADILNDSTLRDSQKVKMIAAYYEV